MDPPGDAGVPDPFAIMSVLNPLNVSGVYNVEAVATTVTCVIALHPKVLV